MNKNIRYDPRYIVDSIRSGEFIYPVLVSNIPHYKAGIPMKFVMKKAVVVMGHQYGNTAMDLVFS